MLGRKPALSRSRLFPICFRLSKEHSQPPCMSERLFVDEDIDKPEQKHEHLVGKVADNREISLPVLPFQQQIVSEILDEDTFLLLGEGLGIHALVALTIFMVVLGAENATGEPLVLILGANDHDLTCLAQEIYRLQQVPNKFHIPNGLSVTEFDFTTPPRQRQESYDKGGVFSLTRTVFLNDALNETLACSRITGVIVLNAELTGVEFCLRLYRARNRVGFIKAFSCRPQRIANQFSGLSNQMRLLNVHKSSLWPRFHILVDESLPRLEVDEIIIEPAASTRKIQQIIGDLIQEQISMIRRSSATKELDTQNWTAEAAFSVNLYASISLALDPLWARLSKPVREAVRTLGEFQRLLTSLFDLDCVEFVRRVESLRFDSEAIWLLSPAADSLVSESRARASRREVPPKLMHLGELFDEIDAGRVILMCNEEQKRTLAEYLLMRDRYIPAKCTEYEWLRAHRRIELQRRKVGIEQKYASPLTDSQKSNRPPSKRRRVRGTSQAAAFSDRPEPQSEPEIKDEEPDAVLHPLGIEILETLPDWTTEKGNLVEELFRARSIPREINGDFHLLEGELDLWICSYDTPERLHELNPSIIVMFDPNLAFTREIERWTAMGGKAEIHFMYYQQSVEELRYLTTMRAEKDAFSTLIREKAAMPMVLMDLPEDDENLPLVRTTRQAGGQIQVVTEPPRIIVDARELRSQLPFLIWQQRMKLVPVTLKVGDYILTPDIVVERKSLLDLRSSFRDGRLFQQCSQMTAYYKRPMLLIEFDSSSNFSLEPYKDIMRQSKRISREIQENITTLVISFPHLRLIWSASPRHTAEIFEVLKHNRPEPNRDETTETALAIRYDSVAYEVLTGIPGVTIANAQTLATKIKSLRELAEKSFNDLRELVGSEDARRITNFLDATTTI